MLCVVEFLQVPPEFYDKLRGFFCGKLSFGASAALSNHGHSLVIRWSFNGHSVVIHWSFNGHSMVIQWSFGGHSFVEG